MKIKKFRKVYDDDSSSFVSDGGSRCVADYVLEFDSAGVQDLVEVGQTDTYAAIQSHRDSVDLDLILKRYAAGDPTALDKMTGFFADMSSIGKFNLRDMLNMNIKGKRLFDSLPVEEKQKYGNDYYRFISSNIGNVDFPDDSGVVSDEAAQVDEKAVADES